MNRLLLRLGALLSTFVFSWTGTSVLNRVYLRFDNVAVGSIAFPPDGRGGFSSYDSRDGVHLIFEHADFPSREAASQAFQNMLRQPYRLVEREVLYDRQGKAVTGERLVITYRADSGVDAAAVISLDDTRLYEIASTSLRHTLSFERAHRRY